MEESPLKKAKPIQRRKKKSKDGEMMKDGTPIPGKKRQRKTSQQSLTSPTTGVYISVYWLAYMFRHKSESIKWHFPCVCVSDLAC